MKNEYSFPGYLYPLTSYQNDIWLMHTLNPGNPLCNIGGYTRFTGDLDYEKMNRSIVNVIRENAAFRLQLKQENDDVYQYFLKESDYFLPFLDFSGPGFSNKDILDWMQNRFLIPFNLDSRLFDFVLIKASDKLHYWFYKFHHLIADGWGANQLLVKVAEKYNGNKAVGADVSDSSLLALIEKDRMYTASGRYKEDIAFWKEEYNRIPERIFTYKKNSTSAQITSKRFNHAIKHEKYQKIKVFCEANFFMEFDYFLAVLALYFCRLYDKEEIVIGVPVLNRQRKELAVIAHCVNNIPVKICIHPQETFPELVKRINAEKIKYFRHYKASFGRVYRALNLHDQTLFDISFSFERHNTKHNFEGLKAVTTALSHQHEQNAFFLQVNAASADEDAILYLDYLLDVFDENLPIEQVAAHLDQIIDETLRSGETQVKDIAFLSPAEQHKLLTDLNNTCVKIPDVKCFHQLFEEQVARTPEQPAVLFKSQSLTYRELNERANKIARYLRSKGVGDESLVGICMECSFFMLSALLGILKAGGAYVPLDPGSPAIRIASLLADAECEILLTTSAAKVEFPDNLRQIICLDTDWEILEGESGANLDIKVQPADLAYILYTSGSTGKPKGVMLEHRNLLHYLMWAVKYYHSSAGGVAATPLSFDATITSLFPPLIIGKKIHLLPSGRLGYKALAALLANATEPYLFKLTPAHLDYLTGVLKGQNRKEQPHTFIIGGENFRMDLLETWKKELFPHSSFINEYGPTEATVGCCTYNTDFLKEYTAAAVPIGYPIDNIKLYVLDKYGQPLPQGVPGELYIAGDGLARGYLNRTDSTKRVFLPNPFEPGTRFYKSGDLVRYLKGGLLEFLGRLDDQVKIRGFRIEPGEIEHRLQTFEEVKASTILVRKDENGQDFLVAYVVTTDGREIDAAGMKKKLAQYLPEYMIPTVIRRIEAFPLTPNNKIDKQTLKKETLKIESTKKYVPPENSTQRLLTKIFSEVLSVGKTGIFDNFFELGGNSLLLARIHQKLQREFPFEISITDLFQYPTISALSRHLDSHPGNADNGKHVESRPAMLTGQTTGRQESILYEKNGAASDLAIIGMAGRFPGADNLEEFWENLKEGRESITFFSTEELQDAGIASGLLNHPDYVKAAAIISGIDMFDAEFFSYMPLEAACLDPQQRIFLECAWEALETAGYDPERYPGSIGVFAGTGESSYLVNNLYRNLEIMKIRGTYQLLTDNSTSFLTTRISYKLNLKGPSFNVQTACSTSLVAVHVACQNLLAGECDIALAGGISIRVPHKTGYMYQPGMILSPDGHCRAFDSHARGTVGGNGAGIIVLKRLDRALADGDSVFAVIKGSAVNNDGSEKVGFTAPSVEGQALVILDAQTRANIQADSLGYLEAHGTGTELGDPIEVAALKEAFCHSTSKKNFCALGSLKSNIGHLDAAAGIASLIKTVLVIKNGQIPPSANYQQPNPNIDMADSPFYVNKELMIWPEKEKTPRRAGVSSFGMGGTNAHVILEEPPVLSQTAQDIPSPALNILLLSARTAAALDALSLNLAAYLERNPLLPLDDVAFTLQTGRREFPHRRCILCRDITSAARLLKEPEAHHVLNNHLIDKERSLVFLFPGLEIKQVELSVELYESEAVFRRNMDLCSAILREKGCHSIAQFLSAQTGRQGADKTASLLLSEEDRTVLFAIEYALARLWMSWGIRPCAMLGHNNGEYTAACLAGVFSLEDALTLLASREQPGKERTLPAFPAILKKMKLNTPTIPIISSLGGDWMTDKQAVDPEYWRKQAALTGQFYQGISTLRKLPGLLLLEVGPGRGLSSFLKRHGTMTSGSVLSSILEDTPVDRCNRQSLLTALSLLWLNGSRVDWESFYSPQKRQRIPLPTYPFQRQRYWIDADGSGDLYSGALQDEATRPDNTPSAEPSIPQHPRPQLKTTFTAPRDKSEWALTEIIQKYSGIAKIGIYDNFFELGLDSLLAIQLISQIRVKMDIELTLDSFFLYPTVESLCRFLAQQQAKIPQNNIAPTVLQEKFPLSFSQEQLFFLDQYEGSSNTYYLPGLLRFNGPLNKEALRKALGRVVERHAALRTNFIIQEDNTFQLIREASQFMLKEFSCSRESFDAHLQEEMAVPFNLFTDMLFRAALCTTGEAEHYLFVNMHHIISDRWSIRVLLKELILLYESFNTGKPDPLSSLTHQYGDYALWQRKCLQQGIWKEQFAYWKQQLEGISPLELPLSYPRPARQDLRGKIKAFELDALLSEKLRQISRTHDVTLFMTLLAAFSLLMHRYSGQDDIAVGTPIANRKQAEWEGLIGFFVNTVVMRQDFSGDPIFTQLLKQIKTTTLGAYACQDAPFEKVVESLKPPRDSSRSPLFQVMFALQHSLEEDLKLPGVNAELRELNYSTAKFDLTMTIVDEKPALKGTLEYATALFSDHYVEGLLIHFKQLLEYIVQDTSRNISAYPLLSSEEERQLLAACNDTASFYSLEKSLPRLFEEQARRTPEKTALFFAGQEISYAELNIRANRLAHYLIKEGVKSDCLVGICMERSPDAVIAILGILKAGGGYVPLRPDYPTNRLQYILTDASPSLVLTEESIAPLLSGIACKQICLDSLDTSLCPQDNPLVNISAGNLAYVLYTSGSSGKPKGVMIEHHSCAAFIQWAMEKFTPDQLRYVLASTSFTFDLSVFELFAPLCSGTTCCLVEDILELVEKSVACPLSLINTVPSAIQALYQHTAIPRTVTTVNLAGEKLSQETVELLYQLGHIQDVYDLYGPTEYTTYSTCARREVKGRENIGKAISNTRLYILDKYNHLVPWGLPGELCLAGAGLARGYVNRPGLTAEKFIDSPFQPGTRLYKTGDLVRYLEDGNLEFLGRMDDQIKLRGFRIEPGEIEEQLRGLECIKEAVVVVTEELNGTKHLVAYIVMREGSKEDTTGLKAELAEHLPDYMIPAAFIQLDAMPRTPNGKVDKKKLQARKVRIELNKQYLPPQNELEKTLARIFCDVLQLEKIGLHDNFFELGGDSILSIQIAYRARKAGLSLKVKDIFSHQTIKALSEVVQTESSAPAAEQGFVSGEVAFNPIQAWFFKQPFKNRNHWNQVLLLKIDKTLELPIIRQTASILEKQHDALRLRFGEKQYHTTEQNHFVAEEILTGLSEPKALGRQITDICNNHQASLNIAKGPLWKMILIKTPGIKGHNRLFIVVHHLIIDVVSWRILLEDIITSITALANQEPVQLGFKTSSFKDYVTALQASACSRRYEKELEYWLNAANMKISPLPRDYTDGRNEEKYECAETTGLDTGYTSRLLTEVNRAYNTKITDILLCAFCLSLFQWRKEEHVRIYLESHGREVPGDALDIQRTIGWFTSLYPVILSIEDGKSLGELIKSTKKQMRAVPVPNTSYGLLSHLHPDEYLRSKLYDRQPLEILFNYLGQLDNALAVGGLLARAPEKTGYSRGLENQRCALLEVNASITGGRLTVKLGYSTEHHLKTTISALAESFQSHLKTIIDHCCNPVIKGYTPSDFPLADLTQKTLDNYILKKIDRYNLENIYPLTPLQEGMLFHARHDKTSRAYTEQFICELEGDMDAGLFEDAWNYLMTVYSVFRTAFLYEDMERPWQIVYTEVKVPFTYEDMSGRTPRQQQHRLDEYAKDSIARGFSLTVAPLMTLALFKCSKHNYWFIWTFHHIILDGWSLPVIMRNLIRVYDALRHGRPQPLASSRFVHFIEYLAKYDKQKSREYWQDYFQGMQIPGQISFKRTEGQAALIRREYKQQQWSLTHEAAEELQSFAKRNHLTKNTLVQGAWALVLQHYCQSQEICFGVTHAGRPAELPAVEEAVGLFINTLPLRIVCQKESGITGWLRELQKQQLIRQEYQFSALTDIHSLSGLPADNMLFDSILAYENFPIPVTVGTEAGSLAIRNVRINDYTHYPLFLTVIDSSILVFKITYNTAYYSAGVIERMAGHLEMALRGLTSGSNHILGDISLLTPREERRLLLEYNRTEAPLPTARTIHELFERQTAQTPGHIALVYKEQTLSYADINSRANRLAHYLIQQGLKPRQFVAIQAECSPETVISILAILKAGCAYVPIDPAYPVERIGYILKDTQAAFWLTRTHRQDAVHQQTKEICLDTLDTSVFPQTNPSLEIHSRDLAYIIYTSGSTGQPRGVMTEHGNVFRIVTGQSYVRITEDDTLINLSSFSFDGSIFDLFAALCNGARLVLLEDIRDLDEVERVVRRNRKVKFFITTALFNTLVDYKPGLLDHIDTILFGGQQVSVKHVKQALQHNVQLIHVYGPTETTVFATFYPVKRETDDTVPTIPIGRPLQNTRLYVMDAQEKPVAQGIPGQLCIGGTGLARGYLNNPKLTAEKFIPDPFTPGQRLYRSGDIVRYLEDGNIEFLGRTDDQVKIRGFRIELAEIEHRLMTLDNIKQCIVITRDEPDGIKKLVAYVVTADGKESDGVQLRRELAKGLPAYMLPSAVITLEAMPLTPNGKVDKKALQACRLNLDSVQEYVPPRTPLEKQLSCIFMEILQVEKVGIYDNFFERGGHSLLATRLVSRIRKEMGIELALRTIFDHPSIEALNHVLEKQNPGLGFRQAPIVPLASKEEVPLSYAQERLWFIDQFDVHSIAYHIPVLLRLEGSLHLQALYKTLNEIVERHESLRTNFIQKGNSIFQQTHKAGKFRLEEVSCSFEDFGEIVKREMAIPFDLSKDHLLRTTLYTIDNKVHYLFLNMHHIISDGWSTSILIKEFVSLYTAFYLEQPNPLEPLPLQYGDYAVWQKMYLQGKVMNKMLSYWQIQLQGSEPLELPLSYPRPARQSYKGNVISFSLSKNLTGKLRRLSQVHDVTLFMTLQAAFSLLLHCYSGQDDICVGTPIANRTRLEWENLIGFFVNTLVLRQNFGEDLSFAHLLQKVKTTTLDAYEHQDAPFEKVVEALAVPRDTSRSPLFQVLFILQNIPGAALELPDLAVEIQEVSNGTAKYDLTLSLVESGAMMRGSLEYATELFSEKYIRRFIAHYKELLHQIVENTDRKISGFILPGREERYELLIAYNSTAALYPRDKGLHHVFEEQVIKTPDSLAVVSAEEELSYSQLNCRANRLSHYLVAQGVKPDSLVAVCLERSVDMLIGLLAILKSGGAYVAFEPSHPLKRIRYILEDTQATLLLSRQSLLPDLKGISGRLIDLDKLDTSSYPPVNPDIKLSAHNLAYVIYTSGSTGKPKGVMIEHQSLVNFLISMQQQPGISPDDRILAVTPISFDIHTLELFLPLITGASLVIASYATSTQPESLAQSIRENAITMMQATPVTWTMLLNNNWKPEAPLKILCGGEAITTALMQKLLAFPSITLFNMYGPTETTVWSTTTRLTGKSVTIGRPINNTRLYILDKYRRPVPKGLPGELHIAGDGLARGYLNSPQLTAEKFITNPFEPQKRLYRTGDLVRYLDDGQLEFLGRIDDQVKIRGFRIEPGEIEQQLTALEDVKESAVVVREDKKGEKLLVAYLTTLEDREPDLAGLKSRLAESLPDYMIPAAFIRLDALPLTTNGKLDKKDLRSREISFRQVKEYVAPRDELEIRLAGIFCSLLNRKQTSIHDNFFDIGGHSLLATQLLSQIREELGIELPLMTIFEANSIANLAGEIRTIEFFLKADRIEKHEDLDDQYDTEVF